MVLYSKHIILESEEFDGFLELEHGKIQGIHKSWEGSYEDYSNCVILPGFIDIHVHGWATGSFWYEKTEESLRKMCHTLPFSGVTSYLGTTGADSVEEIKRCIHAADQVYEENEEGAELLGVHLEGPFINPKYRGMQKEECCLNPDIQVMKELYNTFRHKELCRHMTLAVELPGAREVLEFCREHRIQTAIGHSAATFQEIRDIKDVGIGGFTHTFSGMKGFHHRELGVAGAALYFDDMFCEFAKQTGLTVSHEAFDIAFRIKGSERIILTTDCTGLAQTQTEFEHYVRKLRFVKDGNKVRIEHFDGRTKWLDPEDYSAVKNVEMGYAESVKNMAAHTKAVSERNIEAVKQWQRKGNLFFIATGRNLASIKEQLGFFDLEPDGLILNNGAAIMDKEGKLLLCRIIEKKTALKILRFLHELNEDGSGVSMTDKKINVLSSSGTTTQKACDGVCRIDQIEGLESILQIHRRNKDEAYIRRLCKVINERFDQVSAFANVWNADIVAKGVDKAAAVHWILNRRPDIDEVRVMGDSANDAGMIREFHGVAPVWASAEVRQTAAGVLNDAAELLEDSCPSAVCFEFRKN